MYACTFHVTPTLFVFSTKPSFRSCPEHFPLPPATKDSYYASTEAYPCAHVPLTLHDARSMETRLACLLDDVDQLALFSILLVFLCKMFTSLRK